MYQPANKRLMEQVQCYRNMYDRHKEMAVSMQVSHGLLNPVAMESVLFSLLSHSFQIPTLPISEFPKLHTLIAA